MIFGNYRRTKLADRYFNCRYWHAGKIHAAFRAAFNPSHANRNLTGEE